MGLSSARPVSVNVSKVSTGAILPYPRDMTQESRSLPVLPADSSGSCAAPLSQIQVELDLVGLLAPGPRWLHRPAISRGALAVAGALHGRRCG